MTFRQLLNEIQYGKEYMKKEANKKAILENYDEEIQMFKASSRIKKIAKETVLEEDVKKKIERLCTKLESFEDKIDENKEISPAYKKIQCTAIMESCSDLIKEVNNVRRESDIQKKQSIAKIVADAYYFVENYIDDMAVMCEAKNPLFASYIKEEKEQLEEVL